MRSTARLLLWLFFTGAVFHGVALAQDLVPPKIKSLPGVDLPSGVEVPEVGLVRVRVRIGVDGKGSVEKCDAGQALCDLVADAIAKAEFQPATRDGNPTPSEISVELRVRGAAPEGRADSDSGEAVLEAESAKVERELVYSETAEVDARVQVPLSLELEGIRSIPGTFGEPFRILEVLPGTVPVANGQPYVYVRGAPPSGTVYLYDDIPVPLLFHSALGPATVHSGLIGGVDLYSGAAPARYGGFTGGVLSGKARRIPTDRVHGEAELRIIDASAMLNVPMPKEGSMTFAGRIGYPNLILGAIGVDASVSYWDYQYRTGVDMSRRSRFELVAIGGRDASVFDESDPEQRLSFDLQFHRMEARFLAKLERWELMGAMLYGYDFSDVQDEAGTAVPDIGASIHRIGPRFSAMFRKPKLGIELGAQATGLFGPVHCSQEGNPNISTPCAPPDDPNFGGQDRRIAAGAFVDATLSPAPWVDLSLGVRGDIWRTGGNRDAGVGPRARVTFHAYEIADVFVGWGLGNRPATFAIPLPGLGDVPLEGGLQYTNQTEGGVRFFLPHDLTFETRGYLNIYRDLRFVDIFTNPQITAGSALNPIPAGSIDDSADGKSYGLEVLLQRPFDVGVSTLVSYTLGFSDLTGTAVVPVLGTQAFDYTPSYDVRHVMNGVLAWRAKFGLLISARVFARSGRAEGWLWLDSSGVIQQYVQRVPWFVRLDAQVAYEWAKPGRRMRISLEWINITQAQDAQEIDSTNMSAPLECQWRVGVPSEPCPIRFTTAIWYPNLSFRAVF
jgi:outer membrane receptor protein involved in Fe transport